jgi:hypothetical protein
VALASDGITRSTRSLAGFLWLSCGPPTRPAPHLMVNFFRPSEVHWRYHIISTGDPQINASTSTDTAVWRRWHNMLYLGMLLSHRRP